MLTTLAMFATDYEYEETKVEVNVSGLILEKKDGTERRKGWKELFERNKVVNEEGIKEKDQVTLPFMMKNESCTVYIKLHEGVTHAPKLFTEGQLKQVMKRAGKDLEDIEAKETLNHTEGIGTEATRASVIETGIPLDFLHWKPDNEAMTCLEMVRHVLGSEHYYHLAIKNRGSLSNYESPFESISLISVEKELEFAEPFRNDFLETVRAFKEEDLFKIT